MRNGPAFVIACSMIPAGAQFDLPWMRTVTALGLESGWSMGVCRGTVLSWRRIVKVRR